MSLGRKRTYTSVGRLFGCKYLLRKALKTSKIGLFLDSIERAYSNNSHILITLLFYTFPKIYLNLQMNLFLTYSVMRCNFLIHLAFKISKTRSQVSAY